MSGGVGSDMERVVQLRQIQGEREKRKREKEGYGERHKDRERDAYAR